MGMEGAPPAFRGILDKDAARRSKTSVFDSHGQIKKRLLIDP